MPEICICGHSLEDHATGSHRCKWPCEAGNCDCPDYEEAEEKGETE